MELAQELDDLVLGRRVVTQALTGRLPDLVDRPPSVHEPDDHVRGGREAMEALARQVLEHVPRLAPVLMAMDPRVTPQAWGERRHPVPRRAEQGAAHPPGRVRAATSTAPGGSSRSP